MRYEQVVTLPINKTVRCEDCPLGKREIFSSHLQKLFSGSSPFAKMTEAKDVNISRKVSVACIILGCVTQLAVLGVI
jgi:hypothetical protein